jgi:hypothetical protein
MRSGLFLISCFSAAVGIVASAEIIRSQQLPLAPQGLGLLPAPAQEAGTLGGVPPPHIFEPDPSGGFSRTIFETDEDPNFKISIREYSFPPDKQPHTVTIPTAAFAHVLSDPSEITIATKQLDLSVNKRAAVPANAPIAVVNTGEDAVVVRALIVEAK